MIGRVIRVLRSADRLDRIRSLAEIRLNQVCFGRKPSDVVSFERFREAVADRVLRDLLEPGGEAENAFGEVVVSFEQGHRADGALPFPVHFNADPSFGMVCYSVARRLRPGRAVETGVGYGMTSALLLRALQEEQVGELVSIDLPPLNDADGAWIGSAVASPLKDRWSLRRGSSRRLLPAVLRQLGEVDLFVSDSANVYTMQRWEFRTVWPHLRPGGMAIFNNISKRFQDYLRGMSRAIVDTVSQTEKVGCATALIKKD